MPLPPAVSASTAVCTYFGTERGCRYGAACKHLHYNDFGFGVVHVPWSVHNTYRSSSGKFCSHWALLTEQLTEVSVTNTAELAELLVDLLPPMPAGVDKRNVFPTDYKMLAAAIDDRMVPEDRALFFSGVLPFMKAMVLRSPSFFPEGIPILRQGTAGAVRMSEVQCFVLLSCAFFSLFPGRHRTFSKEQFCCEGASELKRHCGKLGFVNFGSLFGFPQPQAIEKLRCFLNYFCVQYGRRHAFLGSHNEPAPHQMHIEVVRCVQTDKVELDACKLPLCPVRLHSAKLIEDFDGIAQADFANHVLGGGVLNRGCVQEEIRFAVCPELFVSRVVCESLLPNESVIVNGAALFSHTTGYASTFRFDRAAQIAKPTDAEARSGIRNICVVAYDAVNYKSPNLSPSLQYCANWIQRDTLKALVAFAGSKRSTLPSGYSGAVATGNWGCGAFGGDVELKLLQQWIAASAVGRSLEYCTFGNEELQTSFTAVQKALETSNCTVADLYVALLMYDGSRKPVSAPPAVSACDVSSSVDGFVEDDALLLGSTESLMESVELAPSSGAHVVDEGGAELSRRQSSTKLRMQTVFEYLIDQFSS